VRVSIVIPTLDEADRIATTLLAMQAWRGPGCEVVVADGGSGDGTLEMAVPLADRVLTAPRGRAAQMNAGAAAADGQILWFLHADTRPPREGLARLREVVDRGAGWGFFDVTLSGRHPLLRLVEWSMNLRSRWSRIGTGDQGLFVSRDRFERVGGFPAIALMEDVALCRTPDAGCGPPAGVGSGTASCGRCC
jgi:rSAM/selenodomain-associated transferase 2